jgi:hypothetical protein
MIHLEPLGMDQEKYIVAQVKCLLDRRRERGIGFVEVREVFPLNWFSEKHLLPILERHFEILKPHPHFHKWELRRRRRDARFVQGQPSFSQVNWRSI